MANLDYSYFKTEKVKAEREAREKAQREAEVYGRTKNQAELNKLKAQEEIKSNINRMNYKAVSKEEAVEIWERAKDRMKLLTDRFLTDIIHKIQEFNLGSHITLVPIPTTVSFIISHCYDEDYCGKDYRDEPGRRTLTSPNKDNLTMEELRNILTGYGYKCNISKDLEGDAYLFYDAMANSILDTSVLMEKYDKYGNKQNRDRDDRFDRITNFTSVNGMALTVKL